jgi:hypothetical protein
MPFPKVVVGLKITNKNAITIKNNRKEIKSNRDKYSIKRL